MLYYDFKSFKTTDIFDIDLSITRYQVVQIML